MPARMIRAALLLLLAASPAHAAERQSQLLILSEVIPFLVALAGLWLARRALRARFRRAKD